MSTGQPIDIAVYPRLTGVLCRLFELVGVRRLTKPLDPLSDLAEAFAGHVGKPIDDDDDDGDNRPAPIEETVEPTNGGSKTGPD